MKLRIHMSVNLAGVIEVDIVSPTDIKATLLTWDENASSYMDDLAGGAGPLLSPTIAEMTMLTAGELLNDAMAAKVKAALKKCSDDITLSIAAPGADA